MWLETSDVADDLPPSGENSPAATPKNTHLERIDPYGLLCRPSPAGSPLQPIRRGPVRPVLPVRGPQGPDLLPPAGVPGGPLYHKKSAGRKPSRRGGLPLVRPPHLLRLLRQRPQSPQKSKALRRGRLPRPALLPHRPPCGPSCACPAGTRLPSTSASAVAGPPPRPPRSPAPPPPGWNPWSPPPSKSWICPGKRPPRPRHCPAREAASRAWEALRRRGGAAGLPKKSSAPAASGRAGQTPCPSLPWG